MNKKTLIIIAIIIIATVVIGFAALMPKDKPLTSSELPVVHENQDVQATTPSPTPEPDDVQLPPSDNEGQDNLIDEFENVINQEKEAALAAIEKEMVVNEITPEQVIAQNQEIEEAKKQAEANPTAVQTVPIQPVVMATPTPTPKRDADGYIYTKVQAIQTFAAEFQKLKDAGDYNYTSALDEAKERESFTQASFDADLNTLMTNPYSSERLSIAFDDYRKTGDIGSLILKASHWLSMGGDDGPWTIAVTK